MKSLIVFLAATLTATGVSASTAVPEDASIIAVRVPFAAAPPPAEDMIQREIPRGEPIMRRRLTAVRSATLQDDFAMGTSLGPARLPAGTRLIFAEGLEGGVYYCGVFAPSAWNIGAGLQWLCFSDAEKDGRFDRLYAAAFNPGALLPTFTSIKDLTPPPPQAPITVAYKEDAAADRDFYDLQLVHQNSFNLSGRIFFFVKGRRQGEAAWRDIASSPKGVLGGLVSVSSRALPTKGEVFGFEFTVIEKTAGGVVVAPISAEVGEVAYQLTVGEASD